MIVRILSNWMNRDEISEINFFIFLNDEEKLKKVSNDFSDGSNRVMKGCIGVLDGWLERIKCPSFRDFVSNTGAYFSRKGFHAINAQAIADDKNAFYGSLLIMLARNMIWLVSKAQNCTKNFVN